MTYAEVETQARQLSPEEQMRLVENLVRRLRLKAAWETLPRVNNEESEEEYRERLASIPPASALLGIARPADGHIPTDDEIQEDYIRYLEQKYA